MEIHLGRFRRAVNKIKSKIKKKFIHWTPMKGKTAVFVFNILTVIYIYIYLINEKKYLRVVYHFSKN